MPKKKKIQYNDNNLAIAYYRYSSDKQDTSVEQQKKAAHEYAEGHGLKIIREYADEADKPARTMLTSEGGFSRTTHIVRDKKTGKIRLLTPVECERIQGFPSNWTKECAKDELIPDNKRRFLMGNALVVNLISEMEIELSNIIENE